MRLFKIAIFSLLLCWQYSVAQEEETRLNLKIQYNRYIVADSNCQTFYKDLSYTPIVPSEYRDKYSEDTIYIVIGEILHQDTVQVYNGDNMIYSDILTSDPRLTISARFKIAKQDCKSLLRVKLNDKDPVDIGIDRRLHFLYIGYEPKEEALSVMMTNKVMLFR